MHGKVIIAKKRDSNFELLRLFAIFLITIHHIVINNVDGCGYNQPYSYDRCGIWGVFFNSLAIVGVNLFILISGWYGIKRVWKPIISLAVDRIAYGCIALLLCWVLFDFNDFTMGSLYRSVSIRPVWFIIHYFFLVLISPVLENALRGRDVTTIGKWVLYLTVANVGLGYILEYVNVNGYNAYNFVYLYIMGRYLHLFSLQKTRLYRAYASWGLLIWVIVGGIMTLGYLAYCNGGG